MASRKQPIILEQQPRAISPQIDIQTELVRATIYMTQQKFGSSKRAAEAGQLSLLDTFQEPAEASEEKAEIEVIGLDLSESENRAIHALQVLLERTDYQGNLPGQEIDSLPWKWHGLLPRLAITYTDFFEAYQLQRQGDQYQGREREIALEALQSLEQLRTVYYKRRRWTGQGKNRKEVYDIIKVTRPLISLVRGWQGLTEEEASRVQAGQDHIAGRTTKLIIEFSPLWVDGIDSFYLLKPVTLYSEIQQLMAGKRPSRAIALFIEWLLTLNRSPYKIGRELLAEKLRLDYLIRQRHVGRLEKYLAEAFKIAKELGYLLSYQEEASGMLVFELNPERCKRLNQEE